MGGRKTTSNENPPLPTGKKIKKKILQLELLKNERNYQQQVPTTQKQKKRPNKELFIRLLKKNQPKKYIFEI